MSDNVQPFQESDPSTTMKKEGLNSEPAKSLPSLKHLPLRKRLKKEMTCKAPIPESPKATVVEEYPSTPGSNSSGGSSESTISLVHSPTQQQASSFKKESIDEEDDIQSSEEEIEAKNTTATTTATAAAFLLKKKPLKKAYNTLVSAAVLASNKGKSAAAVPFPLPIIIRNKGLPSNPLLYAKKEQYEPEDTIDSFKSAWFGSEEGDNDDEDDEEVEIEVEEKEEKEEQQVNGQKKSIEHKTQHIIKKSNSSATITNKRGRPPLTAAAKRSFSNDMNLSSNNSSNSSILMKREQQMEEYQHPLITTVTTKVATRKNSTSSNSRSTMDGKLYCLCRQPYDATRFMIACDRCDDWFHGECISINESESEFVDLYFCTKCSKITGKKTSWKPKCINPACHKAARIGSHLGHLSKYCSDSCGMQVARARLELIEIKRRQSLSSSSSSSSLSIAQLALLKQRQSRIHSFSDKQDKKRLFLIRQEKMVVRDCVQAIDKKFDLLRSVLGKDYDGIITDEEEEVEKEEETEKKYCGFDSRLILPDNYWRRRKKSDDNDNNIIVVCQAINCIKHVQWKKMISLVFDQERKEQFKLLASLEKERKQIKSRMIKRRSEKEMMKEDLVHCTIEN